MQACVAGRYAVPSSRWGYPVCRSPCRSSDAVSRVYELHRYNAPIGIGGILIGSKADAFLLHAHVEQHTLGADGLAMPWPTPRSRFTRSAACRDVSSQKRPICFEIQVTSRLCVMSYVGFRVLVARRHRPPCHLRQSECFLILARLLQKSYRNSLLSTTHQNFAGRFDSPVIRRLRAKKVRSFLESAQLMAHSLKVT